MNQERIGKFIAECRKEKGMTQAQLAEKIGVTDKTISRWENGHYLPDISLLNDICCILNIEISELLHGKKIKDNIDKKEVDNTIMNLLKLSTENIKKHSRKIIFISGIIIFLLIIVFIIITYFANKNKYNLNKYEEIGPIKFNDLVSFPTKYAQIEKDDGWVCHFTLEYTNDNLNTPYAYDYNCDNLKYSKLDGYIAYGQDADVNGKYTYEVEINHPSYIYSRKYKEDRSLISNYFLEKKFNKEITLNDLNDLVLNNIDKEEILYLFNSAIKSNYIKKYGNYPNISEYSYIISSTTYIISSTTKNNYTWQVGYILTMGHISYINIELKIDNEYLSDIIKNNKANEEQKLIYENISAIEQYILEKQKFSLPNNLEDKRPYNFLFEIFDKIYDFENSKKQNF